MPELERLNLLSKIDYATLEGACLAYGRAKEAGKIVRQQGMISVTGRGAFTRHPAARIERDCWAAWLRFATEFGLTPSARSRIQVVPQSPGDDADEAFLFGARRKGGSAQPL